ncbi:MAG: hypothetical protein ABJ327_01905 [Litoreibacter sp.]
MTISIQTDENGQSYLFTPGDMGVWVERNIGTYRNAATGEPLTGEFNDGSGKFTGGTDAGGAPSLCAGVTSLDPSDIPTGVPWPKSLGDDPRT